MSNKEALRELQTRLAERMQAAREQTRAVSWLAVECAGLGLLFPLKQVAEIFTLVPVKPVPYAQPWLMGVANLRGSLVTVVDLPVFLGLREAGSTRPDAAQAHLVSMNPDLSINCSVLVDRLAGLRGDDQLVPEPADSHAGPRPRFAGARLRDEQGRVWQQIDLEALARHEQFLRVVV